METFKLKHNIHQIIDRIENQELLQSLYDFLKGRENVKTVSLWNSLSQEQKNEVLLSFEVSENEQNLITRDELFDSDS
ncbi:hypothetical protein [Rhodohalobacter sulfatireducens]|uniref:Uncharacterized protein n=1 Tax=Rhodohalobacter sulfatireducens TaxID=2911366 RepID=A0ABS9KHL2_9BACT|nr:hypothetical protein [Rhodohalobacter sulfatireducens]MCG2590342.1 hypothetical protein [Rhodohalobacter sulfatireducens]